jgi:glutathione S-transferase
MLVASERERNPTMLTLYGTSRSRASRSLVALEELGLEYTHVPTQPGSESRSPDFLRINPNGKIPCLDDDGLIVWESLAINLYLADRYGTPPLWPGSAAERAPIYQWSFWAKTEISPAALAIYAAQAAGDADAERRATARLTDALRILDRALADRDHLLGDTFTLIDVNLAASLSEPQENGHLFGWQGFDLSAIPHVQGWLRRCVSRESYARVNRLP